MFVLEPGGRRGGIRELVAHRELLSLLVRRDLAVRYSQTILGVVWVLAQPIALAIVFSVFLGGLAGLSTDGIPHASFYLAGLVPWSYFAGAVARATSSIAENPRLVRNVYLPRLLLPLAAVTGPLVDLLLGVTSLVVVLLVDGFVPTGRWVGVLPATALVAATALAVGLVTSVANARYRDVRHLVPFGIQLLLFACPVAYPLSVVPEQFRPWLALNPLTTAIEGFRWSLTGRGDVDLVSIVVSTAVCSVMLVASLWYFDRAERTVADVV